MSKLSPSQINYIKVMLTPKQKEYLPMHDEVFWFCMGVAWVVSFCVCLCQSGAIK